MQTREKVKLLIAICDASSGERLAGALHSAGAMMTCLMSGQGTAKPAWLDYLGLTETHKSIAFATVGESRAGEALSAIQAVFAGNEHFLAFSIPVNSIAGANAYQMLKGKEALHEL